jgi:hypothetical protein
MDSFRKLIMPFVSTDIDRHGDHDVGKHSAILSRVRDRDMEIEGKIVMTFHAKIAG